MNSSTHSITPAHAFHADVRSREAICVSGLVILAVVILWWRWIGCRTSLPWEWTTGRCATRSWCQRQA